MTLSDLGYRAWHTKVTPRWNRAFVIAQTGIARAWQSRWLRRMVFFSWLPTLWFAFGFFLWEQALLRPELMDGLMEPFLMNASSDLRDALLTGSATGDPVASRHKMWAWLLYAFFRYPQGFTMLLVVGVLAPPLISQDIRSRAFLIYFARPITRADYVVGKFLTIWFYVALISTLPALVLYLLGILLSPQLSVVYATWDLPLRILIASTVLAVPTAALAIFFSSMTQESRYATFAWFATWILGWVTFGILSSVQVAQNNGSNWERWTYFSPYHTLGRVQGWIFGFSSFQDIQYSALLILVVTIISLVWLNRRIAAPMRT